MGPANTTEATKCANWFGSEGPTSCTTSKLTDASSNYCTFNGSYSSTYEYGCYYMSSLTSTSVCVAGSTQAYDSACTAYYECRENSCDFSSLAELNDGDTCRVSTKVGAYGGAVFKNGNLDKSEKKCIQCDNEIENYICGNTSNTYYSGSGNCTSTGDRQCESACGAASACDEKNVGDTCDTGKTCDSSCSCVAGAVITITASPTNATILVSESKGIEYTVLEDGAPLAGKLVTISRTSGTGSIAASCTTDLNGECTAMYSAPATPTTAIIRATIAEGASATTTITVNAASSCPIGANLNFNESSYETGDIISLRGLYTPVGTIFSLCLYDPSGTKSASTEGAMASGMPITVTATATDGTWTGVLRAGISCPNSLSATDTCRASVTVDAASAPPASLAYVCTPAGADSYAEATDGSYLEDCIDVCASAGTPGDCSASSCPLSGGSTCSTPEEACACGGSGGGGGGGTPPSTPASFAVCATDSWFFCNTLAGTVDNIVDAGETMIQAILGLIGTIALLFLIIAGIMYMTAAGDEEKIKSAKRVITGAIIGLGISLLAFSLLQAIIGIL